MPIKNGYEPFCRFCPDDAPTEGGRRGARGWKNTFESLPFPRAGRGERAGSGAGEAGYGVADLAGDEQVLRLGVGRRRGGKDHRSGQGHKGGEIARGGHGARGLSVTTAVQLSEILPRKNHANLALLSLDFGFSFRRGGKK